MKIRRPIEADAAVDDGERFPPLEERLERFWSCGAGIEGFRR